MESGSDLTDVVLADVTRPYPGAVFPASDDDLFRPGNFTITPRLDLRPGSTVFTIGSCFARNIEEVLRDLGFHVPMLQFGVPTEEWAGRPNGILNRYTPQSIVQRLEWAVACIEDPGRAHELTDRYWLPTSDEHGVDIDLIAYTPVTYERFLERRAEMFGVHGYLADADVVVITLGQTEGWYYTPRGLYWGLIPSVPSLRSTWADTVYSRVDAATAFEWTARSVALVRRVNPHAAVLLTVSPVPASRYWTGEPAMLAYWSTKLALREAAHRAVAELPGVHYFPSFEAIRLMPDPFLADRVHVTDDAVRQVIGALVAANVAAPSAIEAS
jgi:hypothetical protein